MSPSDSNHPIKIYGLVGPPFNYMSYTPF